MAKRFRRSWSSAAPLSLAIVSAAAGVTDLRFDYTSFETGFQQPHFDILNYPSINGNYMMTSTDAHRPEMVANNNQLAEFYNWLTDRYTEQTVKNGAAAADAINTYTVNNSTSNGPRPNWIVLNEISSSLWSANPGDPSLSTYRTWLIDCVTRLSTHHGYNVVTLAPFQNPGQNNASWQALSAIPNNYIGIECYLSGPEVWAGGTDYDSRREWAETQYAASKQSYLNRGVPEDKLFVIEHFANNALFTDNGTPIAWGRNNMASASDWDQVIMIRQDAIYNVGFDGFLAYNWGGNGMGVTQAEQLQHEYYYRTRLTLATEQPQWLSDSSINVNGTAIPLSWSQFLNWKGGVPNVAGAVANFYRTNTTARTITLDGSKTVGTLSFNSPNSYTISAGTGGSLTMNNSGAGASLVVSQGTHTLSVPLVAADNLTLNVASTLNINSGIGSTGVRAVTRTGNGTVTISGANSFATGATFSANAGTTNFNSDGGLNLTVNANATVNFTVSQRLAGLTIAAGKTATLSAGSGKSINTGALSVPGRLDLKDGDLIVRNVILGSWNGSSYNGVTGLIASGRGNGSWNGSGVVTSMTHATTGEYTTLAVAKAGQVLGILDGETATWNGQVVSGFSTLVMYTYGGDANLSGNIDIDDYGQIDSNVAVGGVRKGYFNGDFNYDGLVNVDDYGIIDSNIGVQGPSLAAAVSGSLHTVPEPAVFAPFALCACVLRRRHRS